MSILKNDVIFHFIGTLDELNSHLGLIKAMYKPAGNFIEEIQINLMKIMSHASGIKNNKSLLTENEINDLEKEIDVLTNKLPKITEFVLPGKNVIEAQIQIARTVARRAERYFAAASEKLPLSREAGVYLNRLSDYLFFLSQQN